MSNVACQGDTAVVTSYVCNGKKSKSLCAGRDAASSKCRAAAMLFLITRHRTQQVPHHNTRPHTPLLTHPEALPCASPDALSRCETQASALSHLVSSSPRRTAAVRFTTVHFTGSPQ